MSITPEHSRCGSRPCKSQICPVSEKVADYAKHVTETLKRHGMRVHLDDRNEKLPAKIRDAQLQKIPYMLVVGAKEAEAGTVSVRHRSKGDLGPKPLAEVVDALKKKSPLARWPERVSRCTRPANARAKLSQFRKLLSQISL